MKKLMFSIIVALFIFGFTTVQAQETEKNWKVGVGCEGMYAGPLVQGVSVRSWIGPIGVEGDIFQGNAKVDVNIGEDTTTIKGDVWAFELKGMYSLIEKKNSNLYLGAQVSYATFKADADTGEDTGKIEGSAWTYGPFMGAEFSWAELPEIGLNLEVGYILNNAKIDVKDTDVDADLEMNGINVSLGVHYYF